LAQQVGFFSAGAEGKREPLEEGQRCSAIAGCLPAPQKSFPGEKVEQPRLAALRSIVQEVAGVTPPNVLGRADANGATSTDHRIGGSIALHINGAELAGHGNLLTECATTSSYFLGGRLTVNPTIAGLAVVSFQQLLCHSEIGRAEYARALANRAGSCNGLANARTSFANVWRHERHRQEDARGIA
jgi:hypothetical protein